MNSISYFDQARDSSGSKLLGISESASEQLGGYIGKGATRYMSSSGWIPSQAWGESLRYYPKREEAEPFGESWIAFSGKTHTISNVPQTHLEEDVRTRNGVAPPDPEWRSDQLPLTWAPRMVPSHLREKLDRTVVQLLTARDTKSVSGASRSRVAASGARVTGRESRSHSTRSSDLGIEVRL